MNKPAIHCQAAVCGPEAEITAAARGSILPEETGQVRLDVEQCRCACRQELSDRAQNGINLANGNGHNSGLLTQCHLSLDKPVLDPRIVIVFVGIGYSPYRDILPCVPVIRIEHQAPIFRHDILIIGERHEDHFLTR